MKITSVTYRRLRSHPNKFGHDCIEGSAQVSEGETPEEALAGLREWVLGKLAEINHFDETAARIEDVDRSLASREDRLVRLQDEIDKARKAVSASERIQHLVHAAGFQDDMKELFDADEVPF